MQDFYLFFFSCAMIKKLCLKYKFSVKKLIYNYSIERMKMTLNR